VTEDGVMQDMFSPPLEIYVKIALLSAPLALLQGEEHATSAKMDILWVVPDALNVTILSIVLVFLLIL